MTDAYSHLAAPATRGILHGVAPALVTNNRDPDGLGRVKVRLPWLADDAESDWTRVVTPMAGAGRGVWFLPEVDDEVLVAFEHGGAEVLYVLGGLWNGKDAPPESNGDGRNDHRTIRSRSGHVVRLTDTDGGERIEIVDGSARNSIVVSTQDNSITITADADVSITATTGKLELHGNSVEITSDTTLRIEATGNLDLEAGPQLTIQGAKVDIN